jgi:hypothetical protein
LRAAAEIEARLFSPSGVSEEYRNGFRRALLWVLGEDDVRPGSRTSWNGGLPTAELVDAECQLLSGYCYSQQDEHILNQQFTAGGHAALYWALGATLPGD